MSDYTNSGVLFVAREKKSDKSPDYTGSINIDGRELELAGWKRESKNGKSFLSLKISEPYNKKEPTKTVDLADLGDEIPF